MESLTIEIINPKALALLQGLADLNLISISEDFKQEKVEEEEWDSLTEEQQAGILKAIKEIEDGKGIPHEKIVAEFVNKYGNG